MYIRNEFGLWEGNIELAESCHCGFPNGKYVPDNVSSVIVQAVWRKLQDHIEMKITLPKDIMEWFEKENKNDGR